MATSDLFPAGADQHFEGDPPSRDDERHDDEVSCIIFEFEKVSRPGVYLSFELRNAVASFAARKTKQNLAPADATRMKLAVGSAFRAAAVHPETRRMRFLRRGCAAICEAIDSWVQPCPIRDTGRHVRNVHVGLLKREIEIVDMLSKLADCSPAAWSKRQSASLEPLFD